MSAIDKSIIDQSIIDQLIDQSKQEEIDRQQAAEIFNAMRNEEIFQKCQMASRYIGTILGPGWEEIKSFMVEKYNETGLVEYRLRDGAAETLKLTPFKVWSKGDGIHFENHQIIGDRVVRDKKTFALILMILRNDFPAWNEKRLKGIHLQELKKIYEYDLIAWKKEYDRILAANKIVIESAQKDIPPFEIYDLEYSVNGEDKASWNAWVLDRIPDRDPDGEEFYLEVDRNGNVHKKKFFYTIFLCTEAVIIEPGPGSGYCQKRELPGGSIYYGPNINIEDHLPTMLDLPEKPAPPDGLSDWDKLQIEIHLEIP